MSAIFIWLEALLQLLRDIRGQGLTNSQNIAVLVADSAANRVDIDAFKVAIAQMQADIAKILAAVDISPPPEPNVAFLNITNSNPE
jgi:hypothetical protein